MKRIGILIAAILMICGLSLGILESIDWDKYRPELAEQLSTQLGAQVQLKGKLSISILPFPRLAADDAEFEASGVYIRAPSLRLAMKFWPLLTGNIILSRAEIINPEIRLTPERWPAAFQPSEQEENMGTVQLQNLTIKNGLLRLQIGKHQEIFRSINLKLSAPDWHGPYQANGYFTRDEKEWKFETVMGVMTASGTRPLEMNFKKSDDTIEMKWQGAFTPSPLVLQGDGLVQWQHAPPVIWAGEMNLKDDVLDITRGVVAAGDSELGTVVGSYDMAHDKWINLTANLHNLQPHFMMQLPQAGRWSGWLKNQRILGMTFNWQGDAYQDFMLKTAILDIHKDKGDWLVKGKNAAAMLAEVTESNPADWPSALSTPFLLRAETSAGGVKIKDFSFDQTHISGNLAAGKLSLRMDDLLWSHWLNGKAPWRSLLLQNNIREVNAKISRMDVAPLMLSDGEVNLFLDDDADQILWRAGAIQITGTWQNNKFAGKLSCRGRTNFWPVIKNGCLVADINGDQEILRFVQPSEIPAGASSFAGEMNFKEGNWKLSANSLGGEVMAAGKIGNDDWRLTLQNLS
nr:AsmA family protein [Alphaproteobacteria bacterium]